MAGRTLAEARAQVSQLLDDAEGVQTARWSTTQIDIALGGALSKCISDSAATGIRAFDAEVQVNTSAVDGTADLSAELPLDIRAVSLFVSPLFSPLQPMQKNDRGGLDQVARVLKVTVVRDFALPTNAAHPLVGNGAAAAKSWLGFDDWICYRAAMVLGVKDNELRQSLQAMESDARSSALSRRTVPNTRPAPGPEGSWGSVPWLRWTYEPSTQKIQVSRATDWPWMSL